MMTKTKFFELIYKQDNFNNYFAHPTDAFTFTNILFEDLNYCNSNLQNVLMSYIHNLFFLHLKVNDELAESVYKKYLEIVKKIRQEKIKSIYEN